MKKILFIGASNTYGIVGGGVPGPDGYPRGVGYKDVVRSFFSTLDCDTTVRAIFGSASVDWTPDAPFLPVGKEPFASMGPILLYGEAGPDELSRGAVHPWRDFVLPNLPVDIAVILLGLGDAIRGWPLGPGVPTSKADYKTAMLKIINNLLSNGAGKVVLPIELPVGANVPAWKARLDSYKAAIQEIWAMNIPNVIQGPDFMCALTTPGWTYYHSSDILHPNEVGHSKIAELFNTLLITLI